MLLVLVGLAVGGRVVGAGVVGPVVGGRVVGTDVVGLVVGGEHVGLCVVGIFVDLACNLRERRLDLGTESLR